MNAESSLSINQYRCGSREALIVASKSIRCQKGRGIPPTAAGTHVNSQDLDVEKALAKIILECI